MGQRQQVVLVGEVHHGKCQLVIGLFVPAHPGILPEIVQSVVHPAHVPLVVESQSAVFHRTGHALIVGGILGDEHSLRMQLVESLVHPLEEVDA